MSKEERKNKECFGEYIPWCICGELLGTDYRWTKEDRHKVKCEACGHINILEAQIVFTRRDIESLTQKASE